MLTQVANEGVALASTPSQSAVRLGEPTVGDRRPVLLTALAALVAMAAIALLVAMATRTDRQLPVAALAVVSLLLLLSLRWPIVSLYVLVVLIPIESALVLDANLGTVSRYAAILFVVSYAVPRLGRLRPLVMPLPAWAFLIWAILSVGWALDPNETLAELPVLLLMFATAFCVASVVVDDPIVVRRLLWAYSLAAGATAVLGLYGFATAGMTGGERIAALDNQNPAYFAAILLPGLVFTLGELLAGRVWVLSLSVSAVCAAAIVLSGSRATWLSVIIVVVIFLLPRLDAVRRLAAVGLLAGALLILLQIPAFSSLISDRTETAISSGGAGRTDIWTVGFAIYESHPLLGVGLQNFPVAFTPEQIRDTSVRAYETAYREAHSIVVSTIAELGPVGLFLLAMFIGPLILQRGWGPDGAVVQAALAALMINALFLDMLNRRQLWLLLGMACGLAYLARRSRSVPDLQVRVVTPGLTAVVDPGRGG